MKGEEYGMKSEKAGSAKYPRKLARTPRTLWSEEAVRRDVEERMAVGNLDRNEPTSGDVAVMHVNDIEVG
jgi:hypothetical protein